MLRLASKKTKSAQGENTARTLLKIPTSNYQTSISQIATKREKKKNKKRQIPRPSSAADSAGMTTRERGNTRLAKLFRA
jgi:hypothetical protein